MPKSPAELIVDLVTADEPRAKSLPKGTDIELASQKLLFATLPSEFTRTFDAVSKALDAQFAAGKSPLRERAIAFMLGAAESLASPVELSHNLQNVRLHGRGKTLSSTDAAGSQRSAVDLVAQWAKKDKKAFSAVTSRINADDEAANGGANLFAAWAKRWQKRSGRDPYSTIEDYLACFTPLYQRGMYHPDLHFARESGKTRTQFLTESSDHAVRLRRIGCLGCYTKARTADGKAEPVDATAPPFRSLCLIGGLGVPSTPDVIKLFDEILLDGAAAVYRDAAAKRAGDNDIRAHFYHLGGISSEIRQHRVKTLVSVLKKESKFKGIDPASIRSLRDEPVNCVEFILQLKEQGIELKPGDEEDAIDHAGALLVKRAAVLAKTTTIVIAGKRNYLPNQELLDVDYAADSSEVIRDCMMRPVEVDDWKSLWEDMDKKGNPIPGSIWSNRAAILTAIWPKWESTYKAAGK